MSWLSIVGNVIEDMAGGDSSIGSSIGSALRDFDRGLAEGMVKNQSECMEVSAREEDGRANSLAARSDWEFQQFVSFLLDRRIMYATKHYERPIRPKVPNYEEEVNYRWKSQWDPLTERWKNDRLPAGPNLKAKKWNAEQRIAYEKAVAEFEERKQSLREYGYWKENILATEQSREDGELYLMFRKHKEQNRAIYQAFVQWMYEQTPEGKAAAEAALWHKKEEERLRRQEERRMRVEEMRRKQQEEEERKRIECEKRRQQEIQQEIERRRLVAENNRRLEEFLKEHGFGGRCRQ